MQKSQPDRFQVIAGKVSDFVKERIGRILKKRGLTEYKMIQMMCDCIIRYMDDAHNLTPEMERAMAIFEHMVGWENAVNLADPTQELEISEAVYFLTAKGKTGTRAIHVTRPFFTDWQQCENIQWIVERTLNLIMPERYNKLRHLATEMECHSLLEMLDILIDAQTIEQLNAELRKDFEDCNRAENSSPYEYGQRTKRKHYVSPDTMRQQTIHFSEEDVPDLPELRVSADDIENALGGKPFGVEP